MKKLLQYIRLFCIKHLEDILLALIKLEDTTLHNKLTTSNKEDKNDTK